MISSYVTQSGTFLDELDPRIKIFISVEILILISLSDNFRLLVIPMILPVAMTIHVNGIKSLLDQLWALKWYLLVFIILSVTIFSSITVGETLFIITKFVLLYLSFITLSRTTSADQITDGLIKLKLPPKLSWAIGTTMRQVYFVFDEIRNIREIHQLKSKSPDRNTKVSTTRGIAEIIISIFSNGIVRANMFSKTLMARGFNTPHKSIITYSSDFTRQDMVYFVISLIPLISFIILSSQLFIR